MKRQVIVRLDDNDNAKLLRLAVEYGSKTQAVRLAIRELYLSLERRERIYEAISSISDEK